MVIQFSLTHAILIFIGLTFVQWLLSLWIKARLEKSIQHEYDRHLEDYKFDIVQKQKAETIATLFSKWIKYRDCAAEYLDKEGLINFYEELNQMSLSISLWIKDEKLLSDIMAQLNHKEGSKDIRTLTGEVRKFLLGANDTFNPQEIILWPAKEEAKNLFKK